MEYAPIGSKPQLFIITNNHFDPTWRRCWDRRFHFRGQTFASYADIEEWYMEDNLALARKHPGYKFNAEAAIVVRKYLERHPERLRDLRKLAGQGRFGVTGAGDNIIDANMVLGESIVRNLVTGLLWVEDTLGLKTQLGVRNDGFGNSAQVPQIFRGCEIRWVTGFSYSPARGRYWRGLDGSAVCHAEIPTVASGGGCDKYPPCPECHGKGCKKCGGRGIAPELCSRVPESVNEELLAQAGCGLVRLTPEELLPNPEILSWAKEQGKQYDVRFALQEEMLPLVQQWVEQVDAPPAEEVHPGVELNPNNSGVLVTRIRLKQTCRRQEHALLAAESLACLAALDGARTPRRELTGVWQTLLFTMFHDAITATHVDPAYAELQDMADDVDAGTEAVRARALSRLVRPKAGKLCVINPGGTASSAVVSAEVGANADGMALKDDQGNAVPVVGFRKLGNGRAEVQFVARDVPALSSRAYTVKKGSATAMRRLEEPAIENERFAVRADEHGILSIYDKRLGMAISQADGYRPGELLLEHDEGSPWATLSPYRPRTPLAPHTQLLYAEAVEGCQQMAFRCTAPIREHAGWEWTTIVALYAGIERVEFATHVRWDTFNTRLRVAMPVAAAGAHLYGIPYGMVERRPYEPNTHWAGANGDWPAVHWAGVQGEKVSVSLFDRGLPSYCIEDDEEGKAVILLSLLRSPAIPTYLHEPQYYTMTDYDGMRDAGEHYFEYALAAYAGPFTDSSVVADAESYNAGLLAVPGVAKLPAGPQVVGENVRLAAMKGAEKGSALILRLVEFRGKGETAEVVLPKGTRSASSVNLLERDGKPLAIEAGRVKVTLRPWEIATLRVER